MDTFKTVIMDVFVNGELVSVEDENFIPPCKVGGMSNKKEERKNLTESEQSITNDKTGCFGLIILYISYAVMKAII